MLSDRLTVFESMAEMDAAGARWAIVASPEMETIGVLTHGDIRRFLLSGGSLDDMCGAATNRDFFFLQSGSSDLEIMTALAKYDFVPILETGSRRLVDVSTKESLRSIPILEPNLSRRELEKLNEVFTSGWISSKSPFVRSFEAQLENFTGLQNCLAVSNGTVAIHLALEALGVGPGDEVIVPDLTFAATANAVRHAGATPILVDVERDSLGLDGQLVSRAITSRTKAIILVHLFGFPARDYEMLAGLASDNGLALIEDCAESLGTYKNGAHVGSLGSAVTFSFFANKLITTGEGGAVIFKDSNVAERARVLRDHGQSPSRRYFHEVVGFNYRLTGIQAAIGIAQLERVSDLLEAKRRVAHHYYSELQNQHGVSLLTEGIGCRSSFWLNVLLIDKNLMPTLNTELLSQKMAQQGVELRPVFYPLHAMPPYKDFVAQFNPEVRVSTMFHENAVCLPSSTTLAQKDLNFITSELKKIIGEHLVKTVTS